MANNKQPGITLVNVTVESVHFHVNPDFQESEGPVETEITFNVNRNFEDDGSKLTVDLKIGTNFPNVADPPLDVEVTVQGVFTSKSKANTDFFKSFAEVHAPALLFPYAREVISGLTSKSKLPTLLLPPVNFEAILKPNEKNKPPAKKKISN